MRRGFTLVELLIVVVVLVTLMAITFRLGAINQSSSHRNETVTRLQRLENCLSGYYAAFGSYPPVAVHGSRNPYLKVSSKGIQNTDGDENTEIFNWDPEKFNNNTLSGEEKDNMESAWEQVKAACKAQPVGCDFPFADGYSQFVDAWSEQLKESATESTSITQERKAAFLAGFDDGVSQNIGRHRSYHDKTDWRDVQLFKFGLMSFFLPRYLIMMNAKDDTLYEDYAQWTGNNSMPADPLTGQKFNSWTEVRRKANSTSKTDYAKIANIASQAVCARWIPNLAGIVHTSHNTLKVFGVELAGDESGVWTLDSTELHSPGGYDNDGTSGQYVLDSCTVRDGWDNEFYYYSPAPYQTYVLWSSGPNGKTFPPWISRDDLDSKANRCVGAWIDDDIVNMSH